MSAGGVDDKMKEVIFHKYFLGDDKSGRYGNKWDDDNKNTKRLYTFVSKRKFDEYGNITDKICGYCGSLYSINEFGKDKKSRDGYQNRIRKHSSKTNRR